MAASEVHTDVTVAMLEAGGPRPKSPRSKLWPATRRNHLLLNPQCAACGGIAHLEVHHIRPVHKAPELELDPKNLVTLCDAPGKGCHLLFGHLGSWMSWNTSVAADAMRFFRRVLTRPTK